MAYGDYRNAATLLDTCDADVNDTPGKNAGCRFIGQTEEATTGTANRPHLALAENMDNMKLPLDAQIAKTQVARIAGISGPTISIDPLGVTPSDIMFSPAGYLYMGNGDYSGANQEDINTLFQLLDDDFNEVVVNGEEVVIASIAVGPAIGTGFYNGGQVVLQLSATLPVGTYRLAYARETTLATLPDDVLIRADIRGLHEASGENQRINSYICGTSTDEGPVDFLGPGAVLEAISNLPTTFGDDGFIIYVRDGTYLMPSSWPATGDNIRIIGARGNDHVILDFNAALDINESGVSFEHVTFDLQGGFDVTFSNPYGAMRNVNVIGDTPGTVQVIVESSQFHMEDCYFSQARLWLNTGAEHGLIERSTFEGGEYALRMNQVTFYDIRECEFIGGLVSSSVYGTLFIGQVIAVSFEDCNVVGSDLNPLSALWLGANITDLSFDRCRFRTDGPVAYGTQYQSDIKRLSFNNCYFRSKEGVVFGSPTSPGYAVMSLRDCVFMHIADGDAPTYHTSFAIFRGDQITLDNCEFYPAKWDPDGGTEYCLWFDENVRARNILLDLTDQEPTNGVQLTIDYEWFVCDRSTVDGMTINQGATTTVQAPTGLANRVVWITGGAHVRELDFINIGGEWIDSGNEAVLVEVVGSPGTSKLDGCLVGTRAGAPQWTPATLGPAVCKLSGEAQVKRLIWDDQPINASTVQTLVAMSGSFNSLEDSRLIVQSNNDDIRRLFWVDGENGIHNRILRNYLEMTPLAQNGPAGPFYLCAELSGASFPNSWGKGQTHGHFVGNTLRFAGYTQDDGVAGIMLGGPAFFGPNVCMWSIDHNQIIASHNGAGTNPIRHFMFIYEGDFGQVFSSQNRGAGGCSVTGNVLRSTGTATDAGMIAYDAAAPKDVYTNPVAGGPENAYLFD